MAGLDLTVGAGEILGVAGANGAGKSTLFNLLGGQLRLDAGSIIFGGKRIDGLSPQAICRRGIARTFQTVSNASTLTVLENVALAEAYGRQRLLPPVRLDSDVLDHALEVLSLVGLEGLEARLAETLSLDQQRRLMIAAALASRPRLLLVDEPVGGLAPDEIEESVHLVRRISEQGITVVVIEHVMSFLVRVSPLRILIMHQGKRLFEGTAEQVSGNQMVREVWLGDEKTNRLPKSNSARMLTNTPLLVATDLAAGYGGTTILKDVSLEVSRGQCAGVIGPNGHGKTTLIRTLTGQIRPWRGKVQYAGQDVTHWRSFRLARLGIIHVPQGDELFDDLTVRDNLLAAIQRREDWHRRRDSIQRIFAMFPALEARQRQSAATLSGGERRMLAIGRALMVKPSLLILDEPSLGLAPRIVDSVYEMIQAILQQGTTMIVVEESPMRLADLANIIYLLDGGKIVRQGPPTAILRDYQLLHTYLGIASAADVRAEVKGMGKDNG